MDNQYKTRILSVKNPKGKRNKKLIIIKKKALNKYLQSAGPNVFVYGPYEGKLSLEENEGNVTVLQNKHKKIQLPKRTSHIKKCVVAQKNTSDEKLLENFHCQLCSEEFIDQLTFFIHLKAHYEPVPNIMKQESKTANNDPILPKIQDSSQIPNVHCIQCNITFKSRKAYDSHVRDVHIKVELNEFSDHEDIMGGIEVEGFSENYWNDET